MSQDRKRTILNLQEAQRLIDKHQKWIRAWGYHKSSGSRRSFYDAIYDVTQTSPHPTAEFRALGMAANGKHSVDGLLQYEQEHSHKDIMNVFDRAIKLLEK